MLSFTNKLSFPKINTIILWIIFVLPFVIYSLNIVWYATNIPFMDDYDAVLNFTSAFIQTQRLDEKITLLFSQHNEHRIVFDRVIFLGNYYLFHEVNFKSYIMFGNLGWMLTTMMLIVYFQKKFHLPLAYLLPIPYLLLSFNHSENMFFAMAAIQNYWFVFFSVAFLIFLSKDKPLLFCALFPVALFTSGGGIVLYPLGNLFLVLRRKWKSFMLFFMLSTLCVVFYFYNYSQPLDHPSIFDVVRAPFRSIAFFFFFLGNLFSLNGASPLRAMSGPLGFTLFLLSGYIVIKRRGDHFLLLTIVFIILIAVTTTLARSGFGVLQATYSRYSLFPLLALVCIYISFITSISREVTAHRVVLVSTMLWAIFFWGIGVVYYEYTHYFLRVKNERIASIAVFSDGDMRYLLYPDKYRAAQILLTAEQQHIYNYRDQKP